MNIHQQLVERALPIIEQYQDDLLKHDKDELDRYPGRRFLHFTGNTGTHIVTLYDLADYPCQDVSVPYLFGTADRWHIAKGITEQVEALKQCNRMDLILYYNGKTLKAIEYHEAKSIAADYRRSIERQFKS
jgi:hypothetical protein